MLTQDDYMNFIISKADDLEKVFILDSGEGNDFLDIETGWYVEDLSGWLISPSAKEQLLKSKEMGMVYEEFSDSYVFAKWLKLEDGKLDVVFKKY